MASNTLYNEWYIFAENDEFPAFTIDLTNGDSTNNRRDLCTSLDECVIRNCFNVCCFENFANNTPLPPQSLLESPLKKKKCVCNVDINENNENE